MNVPEQNFANHRRIIPLYHFVIFGILVVNAIWSVVRLVRFLSWENVLALAVALALLALSLFARIFALKAQDRIIRLEMRLRLAEILPADLRGRIRELQPGQLIALRFASDGELPDLVREVLTNDIQNRDDIKRRIKKWEADHFRV